MLLFYFIAAFECLLFGFVEEHCEAHGFCRGTDLSNARMNLITAFWSLHGTVQGHFYSALKMVLYGLHDSSKCGSYLYVGQYY